MLNSAGNTVLRQILSEIQILLEVRDESDAISVPPAAESCISQREKPSKAEMISKHVTRFRCTARELQISSTED